MQILLLVLASFFSLTVGASPTEDSGSLKKIAEAFVIRQSADLHGQVSVTIGSIDPRLRLPKCSSPEGFLPPGTRLWGNTTIGIRCSDPAWSIYVQATVKIMAMVVTTAKPLAQGQYLSPNDLTTQFTDITQLAPGALTELEQAIGKILVTGLPAGQVLRMDILRAPLLIKTGQIVKLVVQGGAFQVSTEGKALANGGTGQTISVRTSSGKVVSGLIKPDGSVEVPF